MKIKWPRSNLTLSYFLVLLPNEWKFVLVDQHDKKRDYTLSSLLFYFWNLKNLSMALKKSIEEYEVGVTKKKSMKFGTQIFWYPFVCIQMVTWLDFDFMILYEFFYFFYVYVQIFQFTCNFLFFLLLYINIFNNTFMLFRKVFAYKFYDIS